jgi:hypothetical protein
LFFENGKLLDWAIQKVKGRAPLPEKDVKEAVKFIKRNANGIVNKWTDFFVRNKKVKCEVINKKV